MNILVYDSCMILLLYLVLYEYMILSSYHNILVSIYHDMIMSLLHFILVHDYIIALCKVNSALQT